MVRGDSDVDFDGFLQRRMQSVVELGRTCRERRKVGVVPG